MSEYPKKLVSDEGGVAMVNDAKDEATLKAKGYHVAINFEASELAPRKDAAALPPTAEKPKRKNPVRTPQLPRGPKKRKP